MKDAPGKSIRGRFNPREGRGFRRVQAGSRAIGSRMRNMVPSPGRLSMESRLPPDKAAVAAMRQSRINMTNGLSPCYGFDYYRGTAPPEGRRHQARQGRHYAREDLRALLDVRHRLCARGDS